MLQFQFKTVCEPLNCDSNVKSNGESESYCVFKLVFFNANKGNKILDYVIGTHNSCLVC